jgi:hypothetical protein
MLPGKAASSTVSGIIAGRADSVNRRLTARQPKMLAGRRSRQG